MLCVNCHGTFSSGISAGDASGNNKIDAAGVITKYDVNNLNGYTSIAAKIDDTMPAHNPALCVDDCAEDIAAYIRSQAQVVSLSCDTEDPIIYGERKFVLLTSDQYQATLEDLLGVTTNYGAVVENNEQSIGGFPNTEYSAVGVSVAENYIANAEAIAAWAVSQGKPFACTDISTCGNKFVNDFAYKVYRRPLTTSESNAYLDLFSSYGASEGLELALTAALSSPQFLYIDQTGVDIPEAITEGYYTNTSGSGGAASGGEAETVQAIDFSVKGNGATDSGDVVMIPKETYGYGLQHNFTREFTDPTLVQVEAYAESTNGVWPEMQVTIGSTSIGTIVVTETALTNFSFVAEGITGAQTVKIDVINGNHTADGDTLYVKSVTLSDVVEIVEVEDDPDYVSPLTLADADAYVLTPYQYASALSFMLTGSTPDDSLLYAAANDMLTTPAQIQAQVDRMIITERGMKHFGNFVGTWFKTDEVTKETRNLFPELTADVKKAMAQEVREQFKYVFYNDDVPFSEFYSADYTFLNQTLADYYGVSGTGSFDSTFTKTTVTGRGGPISSGAWMTVWGHAERSAPILRAVHARMDALCHHVEPPNSPLASPDIDEQRAAAQAIVEQKEAEAEAAGSVMSSKEFYYTYTNGIDACAQCHQSIINPMFGLEDFDHIGKLRPSAGSGSVYETLDGKQVSVSLSGSLIGVESVDEPTTIDYSGSKDFSIKISQTEAVQACLVRKGFRFATGLPAGTQDIDGEETLTDEQKEDFGCAATEMESALISNGQSPKAMFSKLGTLEMVRFRK